MLLSARKRRLVARSSTLLVAGVALAIVVPATASATIVPPVALPGVAGGGSRRRVAARARLRRLPRRRGPPRLDRRDAPRDAVPGQPGARRRRPRPVPRRAPPRPRRRAPRADMGRRNYFAHVSPTGKSPLSRARAAGWRGGVGEVIAWGCGTLASPRATLRAWLNSPPHRAIVLGGGRAAGVGVKRLARLRRPRLLGDGRRLASSRGHPQPPSTGSDPVEGSSRRRSGATRLRPR